MIEFGVVTSVNYKEGTVNVTIESQDDHSLENVFVLQRFTQDHKSLSMPREKSIVAILVNEGRAIVLGSIYSEINTSPSSTEKLILDLADGTKIEYDIENSKLTANVNGVAEITSTGDFTIKAPKIIFDGEIEATGKITAQSEIEATGNIKTSGNIETTDIEASGIKFLSHIHPTPNGPSGPPQSGGA